ncbi:MAG: c-type cytochrome biogenesis protein CcsB, partial [Dermatophilaceae bacterium]
MTIEALAQYANLSVYSAMAVFTIAMIAFAMDLAGRAPKVMATSAPGAQREPALVGAATPVNSPDLAAGGDEPAAPRPRRAAGIAMMLTRLGGLLLIAAAAMRGLSVHRPPLGNMFE